MKSLIVYASKHGTTKQCAQMIHNNHEGDMFHIKECANLSLGQYDSIYIGTPVYAGRVNKHIKQWIEQHLDTLKTKKTVVFLSGMNHEGLDEVKEHNFSDAATKSLRFEHVGGAFKIDDMNMFEKFIVKVVAKVKTSVDEINYDKVNQL